jgi:wyosine [tRNA(Phe)-imidazoG37] synthetase (radical SAM superfamily)
MDILAKIKNKRDGKKLDDIGKGYPPSSPRLCLVPFTSVHMVGSGGEEVSTNVCCSNWLSGRLKNPKKINSVDGIYRFFDNNIDVKKVRMGVLDGTYSGCDWNSCPILMSRDQDLPKAFPDINESDILSDITREKILRGDLEGYTPTNYHDAMVKDCNLSCPQCRSDFETSTDRTKSLAESSFDSISKDCLELSFSGSGEFVVQPYLLNFCRNLTEESYPNLKKLKILSNGQLLSERMLDSFSDHFWSLSKIFSISIDASTEESYNKVRKGGDFKKLIRNLYSLRKRVNDISTMALTFVVQRDNFRDLEGFIELAYSLKVTNVIVVKIDHWEGAGDYYYDADVSSPDHRDNSEFKEALSHARLMAKELGVPFVCNL